MDRDRIVDEVIHDDDPDSTQYVIEVDGEVAGVIQSWEEPDPEYRHTGMDISLRTKWHGKGVAVDALRTLARHLIEDRYHHRLTIDPAADNARAIACYAKIGFKPVGILRRYERPRRHVPRRAADGPPGRRAEVIAREAVGMGIGEVYAEGRQRITELASGLSKDQARATAPTCPQWTVSDVVADLTGVCADVLAGNLEGVATDPWTDAQVTARKGKPMSELLAEWTELAPQVERVRRPVPGCDRRAVGGGPDRARARHPHGCRPARRPRLAADRRRPRLPRRGRPGERHHGAQPRPDQRARRQLRSGSPATASPRAHSRRAPFELFRSLTGRRSEAQLRKLDWQGVDPEAYLPVFEFGPFTVPESDIDE